MSMRMRGLCHMYKGLLTFVILLGGYSESYVANAQQVSYTGSAQYATGNYFFTERTGSFYLNNGLSVSGKNVTININAPYIVQSSPWISYSPAGPLPTGGPNHQFVDTRGRGSGRGGGRIDPGNADTVSYTEGSFGDPTLSGSYKLLSSPTGKTVLNSNYSVKFPLADPNGGFGTGAWDFGAGLSVAQRIGNNNIWLADVMYWRLGDMDELDFINPVSFSTGFGHSFANGTFMLSASLFGYSKILEDTDPPLSSGLGANYRVSPKLQLNANLLVGLTESVSDLSTGFGWRFAL